MPSRGMGAISPSKMPTAKRKARRDNTDFDQYAKGGKIKKFKDGGGTEDYPPQFKSRADYEQFLKNNEALRKNPPSKKPPAPLDVNAFDKPFAGENRSEEEKEYPEDDRTAYKRGGKVSRVNEAGNYTKPGMRKALFNSIKAGGKGGAPGQWSARKSQLLAMKYKQKGGGYKD
jgi:hypothetical protein